MKYATTFMTALLITLSGYRLSAQQFFFSAEQPATCAAADGIVSIVPTQGVPPFTYAWSNGATGVSIHDVTKGTYTATLTDATGASVVHSHILNSKELDLYLASYRPSVFCNPASGSLTIEVLGGQAPYSVTWSNGQTGVTAQGLATGTYSVTVQDATGCEAAGEFKVETPPNHYYPFAFTSTLQEPDCINTTNGQLTASLYASGYTPYTYNWSNGATGAVASNLPDGNYSVTVTDDLGCSSVASITLNKAINLTGSVVCNGSPTGTVSAQLVGATAPVSYTWSTGQTGPSLSQLDHGAYGVTATDAAGCSTVGTAYVSIPDLQVSDYSPACYSGNHGVGSCWVNGDDATSFLWDDGFSGDYHTTLSPGIHSVAVTTALGCTLTKSVVIAAPVAPRSIFNILLVLPTAPIASVAP